MPERPAAPPQPATVVRRPAPTPASPRIVLPSQRAPDDPGAGGPVRRVARAPTGPPPRVRLVLRPQADGGFALQDPHGKWLGVARKQGGALRPAWLRFHLEGRSTSWLEVRAGERWRRSGWVGQTKVFLHDFSADGQRLGAVCVPQGAVRPGAAVLCVQDHLGDVVAEVRQRPGGDDHEAFEVLCGGRAVAVVTRLPARVDGPGEDTGPAYALDCGALDPRIVLAAVPFLPEPGPAASPSA